MFGRASKRLFSSTDQRPYLTLVRWVVVYPWVALLPIFMYEYSIEKTSLADFAKEMAGEEKQESITLTADLEGEYPDMKGGLSPETKEQFRRKCITTGIQPQDFNEFVKRLETGTPISDILKNLCKDPAALECIKSVRLAKLLRK